MIPYYTLVTVYGQGSSFPYARLYLAAFFAMKFFSLSSTEPH